MAKKKSVAKNKAIKPQVTPNKVGRPMESGYILDAKKIEKVMQALKMGVHLDVAAAMNKIAPNTLTRWIRMGREDPDSRYGEFLADVERAMAEAEMRDLHSVDAFANGRDAVYVMETVDVVVYGDDGKPMVDKNGNVVMTVLLNPDGTPVMRPAKDQDGKPILKRSEIKPDWRAAAWKLERRAPQRWGRFLIEDPNKRLDPSLESNSKEVITPAMEQAAIEEAMLLAANLKELEDDPFS